MSLSFSTVRYGDSEEQAIDLFLPDCEPRGPAIFFIHGGGWAGGNRAQWHPAADHFRSRGYVCASIGYRLAPGSLHPAQIEDVRCAVSLLKSSAADYGFKPEQTAVVGSSAGGHLAAMLASIEPDDPLGAGHRLIRRDTKPAVAVLYCPATDLAESSNRDALNKGVVRFMGRTEEEAYDEYRRLSPIDRIAGRSIPPTLIIHGDADTSIPLEQSKAYHERLLAAGVLTELAVLEGVKHGFGYGVEKPEQRKAMELMETFLNKVFLPGRK